MLIIVVGEKITDDFFHFPCDFGGRKAFSKVSTVNMQLFFEIIKQYMERVQIIYILWENGLAYLGNGFWNFKILL